MKIFKIEIENYRLLKQFSMDLENELSLVIGKNNSGKTSILTVLEKFLNGSDTIKFHFDDFNVEFVSSLRKLVEDSSETQETDYHSQGIRLRLFIKYDEIDDLSNISRLMMDLDPNNNIIVLGFAYTLEFEDYQKIRKEFREFERAEKKKKKERKSYIPRNLTSFLKRDYGLYFKPHRHSIGYNITEETCDFEKYIDLKKEEISLKDVISFKYISARRDVSNKDIDKTLSRQTSRIYKRTETNDEERKAVEDFQDVLTLTDNSLTNIYSTLFKEVVNKVRTFGGIRSNESEIEIISTLQHRELLDGNTTVVYRHNEDTQLPEHYNGLGYMNLITMIFEIEILVQEFKKDVNSRPADINLLFIEEPEAHTHPQMQYVFIKNIKKFLKNGIVRTDGIKRELQYIISTHSSHIVADSEFDDIKYLKKHKTNQVISKNLKDLKKAYSASTTEEQHYRFLKQYLTLNRAELFFADKAIFIEGDTERILLPAMMKKIDQETNNDMSDTPLMSQNISIIEVGAHSQVFEKFIDFIGIRKSLIITDIDSYYEVPVMEADGVTEKKYQNGNPVLSVIKCPADDTSATTTSNYALIFFHNGKSDIGYYKDLKFGWKILRKNRHLKWVSNRKGSLCVLYQKPENGYHARSFEDAFFELNSSFIKNPTNIFPSITAKHLKNYQNGTIGSFSFAEKGVGSKPSLAIEILMNSTTDTNGNEFSNWEIPAYIKEGLQWLKKD